MTNGEAINWIINISADIGKAEHRDLWHYEQALSEIKEMLETAQPTEASCWGCNCPKMERLKEQKTFSEMVHLHDAEQQWIPCSEPPTEHGFYHEILLYGKDGNYAVGWYDEDYFTWDDRFDMDTPVAWCKLPDPWRGEEHETD